MEGELKGTGDEEWKVAVNFPARDSVLNYLHDPALGELQPGRTVLVPLGRRKERGMALAKVGGPASFGKLKKIDSILLPDFLLPQMDLKLFQWTAKYYHYGLGKLLFDCIPEPTARAKAPKSITGTGKDLSFELTADQDAIAKKITQNFSQGFSRYLIHGITGSGKTMVYLQLIRKVLAENKSILFLLPEINLTPQFLETFQRHLDATIYPYHSDLKKSEKFGLWQSLCGPDAPAPMVIIGTRSSIFLPIKNLGLVIVDEEHDSSFKQEDRCPYNARDLAIKKASLWNVPVVLGSATPSLESYFHHMESGQNYFQMKIRANGAILPKVEIISTSVEGASKERNESIWPFTDKSVSAIKEALDRSEQVLVFLNRLGFAHFVQCPSCKHKFSCQNCSSNLKYFKQRNRMSCAFCDFGHELPGSCPKCGCMNLLQRGFGTEKIIEVLKGIFPNHRMERFDRDEIKNMAQLEQKLERFHNNEIDILVGTQMLSKGHNFKRVRLVLVLGVDSQLNFPDFRANERTFQLLTQVSGRSGRFGGESSVLVQSMDPGNGIFSYLEGPNYFKFHPEELRWRKEFHYPPFSKLAVIYLHAKTKEKGQAVGKEIKDLLSFLGGHHFNNVLISGPKAASTEKKVNKYSFCFMLRSSDINGLHNMIHTFLSSYKSPSGVQIKVDVDPYTFQ